MVDVLARVMRAGADLSAGGRVYLRLRRMDGAYERWFFASDNTKKEMLTIGLTAMSAGLPVVATLASEVEYDTIISLSLSY